MSSDEADADERAELLAQRYAARRHHNSLMQHPDCMDPDHPGCEACDDEEGE